MSLTDASLRAGTLIEALPYLHKFRGQTCVIKYGGSAMESDEAVERRAAALAHAVDAPRRLRFEVPSRGLRVDARLQDHRVNVELPDEAFMLEAPRGVTIERL
jgi:hypothetical protein